MSKRLQVGTAFRYLDGWAGSLEGRSEEVTET